MSLLQILKQLPQTLQSLSTPVQCDAYLDTGKSCNMLAICQEEPKQITMAYSCGLTISKGIKAKLFEDPAMQDAQHLKSMSLKIRSYAIQRKDNCKLTEILQQTKSQTAAASKGRQVFKQQQII